MIGQKNPRTGRSYVRSGRRGLWGTFHGRGREKKGVNESKKGNYCVAIVGFGESTREVGKNFMLEKSVFHNPGRVSGVG